MFPIVLMRTFLPKSVVLMNALAIGPLSTAARISSGIPGFGQIAWKFWKHTRPDLSMEAVILQFPLDWRFALTMSLGAFHSCLYACPRMNSSEMFR